jgi:hypothetical protein
MLVLQVLLMRLRLLPAVAAGFNLAVAAGTGHFEPTLPLPPLPDPARWPA